MRLSLALAAAALAAATALAAGSAPDASTPAPAPAFGTHAELRQRVRELLLARPCRECHLGYLETAVPRALKVFDLAREDWPATMQDRQVRALRGRMGDGMSPSPGPDEAVAVDASQADLDTVDRFIQAELDARAGRRK